MARSIAAALVLATALGVQARARVADKRSVCARAKPATLTVWLMPNGARDNMQAFTNLVAPFVEANPGLKVNTVIIPWEDALSRIEAAVAGHTPAPDITQLGTTWIAAIGATGELLDLTGKYDEKLFPAQVLATTEVADDPAYAGKRFALPWLVDTRAVYYNKDYCRQVGIDPAKDFATWDSFRESLRKLKQVTLHGKPVVPLGVSLSTWNVIHSLSWWIWGAGGEFVGSPPSAGIASPKTLAGIEYYANLAREGLLLPGAEEIDQSVVTQMLWEGSIAATICRPVRAVATDKLGIAPIPAGPYGRFTFLGGSALAVLKSSEHVDHAVALLRFLSTEGAQMQYSMETGALLAAAGQYDELLLQLDPIRRTFVAQMKYGRAYPSIPLWGEIEVILRDGLERVWAEATRRGPYNRSAVQRQLDEMQREIDVLVRRKN